MDYKEAMGYIHEAQKFGSRPGLDSIGKLLEYLVDPQKRLKYVPVAGTNGKGSTVAFISQVLMEAGYLVGIYTSPYIQRFSERIKVNDKDISEADIARITGMIKQAVDRMIENGEDNGTRTASPSILLAKVVRQAFSPDLRRGSRNRAINAKIGNTRNGYSLFGTSVHNDKLGNPHKIKVFGIKQTNITSFYMPIPQII